MSGKMAPPKQSPARPSRPGSSGSSGLSDLGASNNVAAGQPEKAGDPQWERAHQAWHLLVSTPASALTSSEQSALFKVIRAKRSERETLLNLLPGAVRKGARVDLAVLEQNLKRAGISCSLEYFGESQGDQK